MMHTQQQRLMMFAIGLGVFTSHYSVGSIHTALPMLGSAFSESLNLTQWVTTGYLLAIAASLPLMGRLSERFGLRRIHNGGYLLFAASSLLMTVAPSLAVLLTLRIMQGIGAAMYQATNMALITFHLPADRRGRAMGTVASIAAIGAMVGPFAGGVLIDWLDWRWLFALQGPILLIGWLLARRAIPADTHISSTLAQRPPRRRAWLFSLAVGGLIGGLALAAQVGWHKSSVWLLLGGGAFALCLSLAEARRAASTGFLPPVIWQRGRIGGGLLVSIACYAIANLLLAVLPFYLAVGTSLSAGSIGIILLMYPLALAAVSPISGFLADRYKTQGPLLQFGLLLMGVACALLWLFGNGIWVALLAMAAAGVGMGLLSSPNNRAVMSGVSGKDVGIISSLLALTRNIGMAVGSALGLAALSRSSELSVLSLPFVIGIVISCSGLLLINLLFSKRAVEVS